MTDWFLIYAAGFFDGEGCVDIRWRMASSANGKKYERFDLRVHIPQLDPSPLVRLHERWGGGLSVRKASKVHQWVIANGAAGRFIADVFPYLIVKKDEAAVALEFQATMRTGVVNTVGSKGVDPISPDVRERRRYLHHRIREVRVEKGVRARPSRVMAPAA